MPCIDGLLLLESADHFGEVADGGPEDEAVRHCNGPPNPVTSPSSLVCVSAPRVEYACMRAYSHLPLHVCMRTRMWRRVCVCARSGWWPQAMSGMVCSRWGGYLARRPLPFAPQWTLCRAASGQGSGQGTGKPPKSKAEIREEVLAKSVMHIARGGGPGGQSINKTMNAVTLIHEPTGVKVRCSLLPPVFARVDSTGWSVPVMCVVNVCVCVSLCSNARVYVCACLPA